MGNTTPSGDSVATAQLQIEHVPIGDLRPDPANRDIYCSDACFWTFETPEGLRDEPELKTQEGV